ncbi:MAG: polysaccharide biosynthesis/export family protein [Myxococcota bacterium]|nr:polysaccharide biosynthesis/export family protein [Myxococcota bacterium]
MRRLPPLSPALRRGCCLGLVLSLGALTVCGCGPKSGPVDWAELSRPRSFKLGGGDKIHVDVEGNAELSRELVVRPDGRIDFPLIGEVEVRDQVPEQLAATIAAQLERFVKSPVVSISVREVNSYAFYVLGEVKRPGEFKAAEPRTVLQALALAGGFTPFASPNRIHVLRKRPAQTDLVIPIRYHDIVSGEAAEQNIPLQSGDTVVVPD